MCERRFCAATMCAMTQRRTVLKLAVAAAAGFLPLPHALAQIAKAPPKPANVLSPDAALQRLMQGNARYVDGVSKRHDFSHEREPLRAGQNPFAGILSCADSRIAPEYCFDTARGDIFVCRVAGNFASAEIVASFEYAGAENPTRPGARPRRLRCGRCDNKIDQGWHRSSRPSAHARRRYQPGRQSSAR